MTAFEIVTIVFCAAGIALALSPYFRVKRGLTELAHQGSTWFEHPQDRPTEVQPSEDAMDAPIPRRPLRARWYSRASRPRAPRWQLQPSPPRAPAWETNRTCCAVAATPGWRSGLPSRTPR